MNGLVILSAHYGSKAAMQNGLPRSKFCLQGSGTSGMQLASLACFRKHGLSETRGVIDRASELTWNAAQFA